MRPLLLALPALTLLCLTPSHPAYSQDKKARPAEDKIDFVLGKAYKLPSEYTNQESTYFSIVAGLNDRLYVGTRFNTVRGELAGMPTDITVNRWQYSAGWFVTPLLLTKVEWVNQSYVDFPTSDIRNGGLFKGFMVEGTLAF